MKMFDYLVERRKKYKISRQDIAKKVHISVRTYEKYESGELDICKARFDVVTDICELLEINPRQLLFEYRKYKVSEKVV